MLRDKDDKVRRALAGILGRIGPAAAAAVPALIEMLRDKDHDVGKNAIAAEALERIGPAAKTAVPALTELLREKDVKICIVAAHALGGIGPEAKAAVPALAEFLRGPDSRIRHVAVTALGNIGPGAEAAIPALADLLRDNNERGQGGAAGALARIGLAAVPALTRLLRDKDNEIRVTAARVLTDVGAGAKSAVPILTELLRDKDDEVRIVAAQALGQSAPGRRGPSRRSPNCSGTRTTRFASPPRRPSAALAPKRSRLSRSSLNCSATKRTRFARLPPGPWQGSARQPSRPSLSCSMTLGGGPSGGSRGRGEHQERKEAGGKRGAKDYAALCGCVFWRGVLLSRLGSTLSTVDAPVAGFKLRAELTGCRKEAGHVVESCRAFEPRGRVVLAFCQTGRQEARAEEHRGTQVVDRAGVGCVESVSPRVDALCVFRPPFLRSATLLRPLIPTVCLHLLG